MLTILHLAPFEKMMPDLGVVVAWFVQKMVLYTLTTPCLDPFALAVPDFAAAAVPIAPRCRAKPIAENCPSGPHRGVDQNDSACRSGIDQ